MYAPAPARSAFVQSEDDILDRLRHALETALSVSTNRILALRNLVPVPVGAIHVRWGLRGPYRDNFVVLLNHWLYILLWNKPGDRMVTTSESCVLVATPMAAMSATTAPTPRLGIFVTNPERLVTDWLAIEPLDRRSGFMALHGDGAETAAFSCENVAGDAH